MDFTEAELQEMAREWDEEPEQSESDYIPTTEEVINS